MMGRLSERLKKLEGGKGVSPYAYLSDEQLSTRILEIFTAAQESGVLTHETSARIDQAKSGAEPLSVGEMAEIVAEMRQSSSAHI
jgi:hypothetical protein